MGNMNPALGGADGVSVMRVARPADTKWPLPLCGRLSFPLCLKTPRPICDPMKHKTSDLPFEPSESLPRKRMTFGRAMRYQLLKFVRIRATPHAIGIGVATGIFSAFLPLVGVHMALAAALAWMFGGNMIAAVASTLLVGNPITYPFVWAAAWETGQMILGSKAKSMGTIHLHELVHKLSLGELWAPILKPLLIGSIPLGLAGGLVGYFVMVQAVTIVRARRQARLNAR